MDPEAQYPHDTHTINMNQYQQHTTPSQSSTTTTRTTPTTPPTTNKTPAPPGNTVFHCTPILLYVGLFLTIIWAFFSIMHRDQAYPSGMHVVTIVVYCNFIATHIYLLNAIAQLIYRCILVRNIAESDKIPSGVFIWHIARVVVGGAVAVLQIVALIAALSIWSAEETDEQSRTMSWFIPIACVFAVLYLCTALVEVYAMLRVHTHNKWVQEVSEQQHHINMDNAQQHTNQEEISLEQYQHDTSGYIDNTCV